MNKYIRTTLTFIGIWFIASLLNGVLSGVSIVMVGSDSMNDAMGNLAASFVLSFVLSVPLVGLVWFVAIVAEIRNKKGDSLLQLILGTTLICSVVAALIFIYAFKKDFPAARYAVGACIIVSTLTSVLFFRKQIKTNE